MAVLKTCIVLFPQIQKPLAIAPCLRSKSAH
jgi:hypothetical protein